MQELDPESRSDPTANRTGSKDSIRSQSLFTCSIQYGMRTQIDLNPPCKRSNWASEISSDFLLSMLITRLRCFDTKPDSEFIEKLGFILDHTLSWDKHISYVATKLSRDIFLLRHLSMSLINILKQLILPTFRALIDMDWAYGKTAAM